MARVAGPEGFRAALETLVGAGIGAAPPFALLDGDAAVLRVVLRGETAVTATIAGAELTFSGSGMATWTERVLEGVAGIQLTVPGSSWWVALDAAGAAEAAAAPVTGPSAAAPAAASAATAPTTAPAAALTETTLVPRADPQPDREEPRADPDSEAYDFLFGDTIYRTQAGVSVRIPNPDPERPGDHDGQTMLADELGLAARESASAAPPPTLPLAPALQLERHDGSRESLSRPVLIGRSPVAATAPASGPEARLITIVDDPDISRTHLRVAVEGDAVVVTDLGSKNGTLITLPGSSPRKLRGSEPTVVLPGTLIDLGGGTVFTVRED
jgi:hypothetical protein